MTNIVNLADTATTPREARAIYQALSRMRLQARLGRLPDEATRFDASMRKVLPKCKPVRQACPQP